MENSNDNGEGVFTAPYFPLASSGPSAMGSARLNALRRRHSYATRVLLTSIGRHTDVTQLLHDRMLVGA